MSWTGGAAHNSENLNLIASPTIAAAYAGHWNQRLALSLPYTQREDWCRRPEVIDSNRNQGRDEKQTGSPARGLKPVESKLARETTATRDRRRVANQLLEGMRRLWWRAFDRLCGCFISLRLSIFDRIHRPDPPTPADLQREANHEWLASLSGGG